MASSWRNKHFDSVVEALDKSGLRVYDFKRAPGAAFGWHELDPNWQAWKHQDYFNGLNHPRAQQALRSDCGALSLSRAVVLVLPCGRSAHLEAGWAVGAGKPLGVYMPEMMEPELMYGLADMMTPYLHRVVEWATAVTREGGSFPRR